MNHIHALAIANSLNQDRLETAARRRHQRRPARPGQAPRRAHVLVMIRALLAGYRAEAQPSR